MGSVSSTPKKSLCDSQQTGTEFSINGEMQQTTPSMEAPPTFNRPLSFEERLYKKVRRFHSVVYFYLGHFLIDSPNARNPLLYHHRKQH